MDAFEHLSDRAKAMAALPDSQRLQYINSERWVGYSAAVNAVKQIENLIFYPQRQRMPNILLVGPTNNGKSMIVERVCRRHRPVLGGESDTLPVVAVQMPAVPTIARFYSALLSATGAPFNPRSRPADLEDVAIRVLKGAGVRLIIIDEIHNILAAPTPARHAFLNVLRYLGNELRVSLVGVGTQDAYLVIRSDPQLENRFMPLTLPLWTRGEELLKLLSSFQAVLPLRRPSTIVSDEMAEYLLARSEGTIGELCNLLASAAVAAITSGEEALNTHTLELASYLGPTLRRQKFERATG